MSSDVARGDEAHGREKSNNGHFLLAGSGRPVMRNRLTWDFLW